MTRRPPLLPPELTDPFMADPPVIPFPPNCPIPEADWAEQAVIGTVLTFPERYDDVRGRLTTADFHDYLSQLTWRAIVTLADRGLPTDAIAVKNELVRTGQWSPHYLTAFAHFIDAIPQRIDLGGRVDRVLEAARFRRLQATAWQVFQRASRMEETPDALLTQADYAMRQLSESSPTLLHMGADLTAGAIADLHRRLSGEAVGLQTGLAGFDHLTSGLTEGQLVVFAGRPGTGKTALACTVAHYVAQRHQVVLFVSLEMGLDEIATRCACLTTGLSYSDVRTAVHLSDAARGMHMNALGHLESSGLAITDTARTVSAIRQQAKALKARAGRLDLIVVDYLQLMRSDTVKPGESRVYEIGDISIELKMLARDLEIPVITLAQLNRQIETRSDRTPQLSDLRDSGQIEQDADIVAFTHQATGTPDDARELIIRKHRNGPTATIPLRWDRACMRFSDWS